MTAMVVHKNARPLRARVTHPRGAARHGRTVDRGNSSRFGNHIAWQA